MYNDDDILLHYGKKGMKWGVRKKVVKAIKTQVRKRNEKKKANLEKYHEKRKNKKGYKREYNRYLKKNKGNHLQTVRKIKRGNDMLKAAVALKIGAHVAPFAIAYGRAYARDAANFVTRPENIRKGKNIILAMKRSKIRYADVSKFKDIIDM